MLKTGLLDTNEQFKTSLRYRNIGNHSHRFVPKIDTNMAFLGKLLKSRSTVTFGMIVSSIFHNSKSYILNFDLALNVLAKNRCVLKMLKISRY